MIGRSQLDRTNAGCTSARCEPATTRSWPDRASAPVTEMPVVSPQHRYECMPSEQSLCHGTSEMPSTTPIGFTSASMRSPVVRAR